MDGLEQRSDSVPHDLHANANEEKSGKPDDDVHRGRSPRTSEPVRESVTEVNADADQQGREQRCDDQQQVEPVTMRRVRAQRDRDRDGPGPDRQWQGQGIESLPKNILRLNIFTRRVRRLVFQTPMVMVALARIGLVNAKMLRKYRRYAAFGILLFGGIAAPDASPITMLLIAAPMYVLYEASIWIIAFLERGWRRSKAGAN